MRDYPATIKKVKIMKSIEMNQALMEAINTTEVLGASALEETRALRQLIASANTRIEELTLVLAVLLNGTDFRVLYRRHFQFLYTRVR